jgi:hypothetical protein
MAAPALIESYRRLRKEVVWSLLAADTAPETIAFLQVLLFDTDRRVRESVLIERLTRILNDMRTETVLREQTVALLAQWRRNNYIVRTLVERDDEPYYELSAGAFDAVSFIASQTQTRVAPTGSRLELLIHAIKKLTDDTDTDVQRRIERLQGERRIIDKKIAELKAGNISMPSEIEVRSQIQDIVGMVEAMDSDFLRVRDRFVELANNIHADILQSAESRGAVLSRVFSGYDNIRESDEGKTFDNFYQFLYEELTSRELDALIAVLEGRDFWTSLEPRKRELIEGVLDHLGERTRETQLVMKRLAAGLRQFVQSREYLQNKALQKLLDQTRKLSVELAEKQAVRLTDEVFNVRLTHISASTVAGAALFDPRNETGEETLEESRKAALDIGSLAARLAASEINYAWLKHTVELKLSENTSVSIGDILKTFPAQQGLATVVGYLHLALEKAQAVSGKTEEIEWKNRFGEAVRCEIPLLIFTRDLLDENGHLAV